MGSVKAATEIKYSILVLDEHIISIHRAIMFSARLYKALQLNEKDINDAGDKVSFLRKAVFGWTLKFCFDLDRSCMQNVWIPRQRKEIE